MLDKHVKHLFLQIKQSVTYTWLTHRKVPPLPKLNTCQ